MIKTITARALKDKMDRGDKFRLIETLLPEFFNDWHLPGAENIPADDMFETAPGKLGKSEEIILYCASFECRASTRAAKALEEMGYQNIVEYSGGKAEWKSRDYPIIKG